MEIYKIPINENDRLLIQQFIEKHNLQDLWKFLICFQSFLKQHCNTELAGFKPPNMDPSLSIYLANIEAINQDLVDKWPKDILLSHAGCSYRQAAIFYQQRVERDEQKSN